MGWKRSRNRKPVDKRLYVNLSKCSLADNNGSLCCNWCGRLLNKSQMSWCSGMCFNRFMKNHVWDEARAKALERDGYRCVRCGRGRNLEVNHIVPLAFTRPGVKNPYGPSCAHHLDGLEVLCHGCHLEATAKQRSQGLFKGKEKSDARG